MQQMFVIGNLIHSPEMRMTPTGKTVANFEIATNSLNKNAPTEFFKIVAWDKLAELCNAYVTRGKKICVVGTAAVEAWIGKDGQAKGKIVITAKQLEFLSPREDTAPRGYSTRSEDLRAPWDDGGAPQGYQSQHMPNNNLPDIPTDERQDVVPPQYNPPCDYPPPPPNTDPLGSATPLDGWQDISDGKLPF